MLKNIDPILSPRLLEALRAMGHGDELCLVDANFPAEAVASATQRPLIRLDGVSMNVAAQAIFSVLPLDSFVPQPILRMEIVGDPVTLAPVQHEVLALAAQHCGPEVGVGSLERFAFYAAARKSFAVVATGDRRPYGCFLLKKGVIFE